MDEIHLRERSRGVCFMRYPFYFRFFSIFSEILQKVLEEGFVANFRTLLLDVIFPNLH